MGNVATLRVYAHTFLPAAQYQPTAERPTPFRSQLACKLVWHRPMSQNDSFFSHLRPRHMLIPFLHECETHNMTATHLPVATIRNLEHAFCQSISRFFHVYYMSTTGRGVLFFTSDHAFKIRHRDTHLGVFYCFCGCPVRNHTSPATPDASGKCRTGLWKPIEDEPILWTVHHRGGYKQLSK